MKKSKLKLFLVILLSFNIAFVFHVFAFEFDPDDCICCCYLDQKSSYNNYFELLLGLYDCEWVCDFDCLGNGACAWDYCKDAIEIEDGWCDDVDAYCDVVVEGIPIHFIFMCDEAHPEH